MATTQVTSKDRVLEIVRDLPADTPYDDILRELAFARVIDQGLQDSRAGRTVSNREAKHRIDSWSE